MIEKSVLRRLGEPARGIGMPQVLDAFVGLVELILVAWCVPLVILVLGFPLVLIVRLILEIARRL